jgi:cardiolipin synthase A/B
VDGHISLVGSANLDYRSIEQNCELSVVVHSTTFGAAVHDLFENDVRFACRIVPENWRRRPLSDRVVQSIAKRARVLL